MDSRRIERAAIVAKGRMHWNSIDADSAAAQTCLGLDAGPPLPMFRTLFDALIGTLID